MVLAAFQALDSFVARLRVRLVSLHVVDAVHLRAQTAGRAGADSAGAFQRAEHGHGRPARGGAVEPAEARVGAIAVEIRTGGVGLRAESVGGVL